MDSTNPDPAHIPDDDLTLQNYQDDLDTSSSITDPVMSDVGEDITKELGVEPNELKKELDKYDFENGNDSEDDRLEDIESRDLDPDETSNQT